MLVVKSLFARLFRRSRTREHHDLLDETYRVVERHADGRARIYAEHGIGESGNGTRIYDDIAGYPDMLVLGWQVSNLIIEVETSAAVERDPRHIVDQLDGFKKQGFRRVLVVPKESIDDATDVVTRVDGRVTVTTPRGVASLL